MKMKIIIPIFLAVVLVSTAYVMNAEESEGASIEPSGATLVGDLYYTFSGTEASVKGISSDLSTATSITVPDTVTSDGVTYSVTSIADANNSSASPFGDLTSLQTIVLPSGLTSIGSNAFYGCTHLALTELPAGLTSIGYQAFRNCAHLALTELPAGLTSIGFATFSGCTQLALTELPAGLTSIGNSAFYQCTHLALTELPAGLTSIGESAFGDNTSLNITELPAGLTSIGAQAFRGCTGVTSLVIRSTISFNTNTFTGSSVSEILDLGSNNLSAGSYGLSNNCVVRTNLEDVAMIQQVEYEEHTTEVVQKEGSEYELMAILPVFIILGSVMTIIYALIRWRE